MSFTAPLRLCVAVSGLFLAAIGSDVIAQPVAPAALRPTLTNVEFLEQFAATNRFRLGQPTAITITPDASAVLFLRAENGRSFKQDLWMFDIASKQERLLLTADQLLGGKEENLSPEELARRERMRMSSRGISSYQLSDDGKQLLVPLSGNLFITDFISAFKDEPKTLQLTTLGGSIDPQLSPSGGMVAYVRGGELLVQETNEYPAPDGRTETLVSPQASGNVTYGEAEFVAQEEMGRRHGFWWAPDSSAIAYQSTDTTGVEVFTIADAADPAKPAQTWPYPRAGTKNADVRLFLRHIEGFEQIGKSGDGVGSIIPVKDPIEVRWDRATYPYLAKVVWEKHGPLTILVQNRLQTEQILYAVDDKTGEVRELLKEQDETWINIQDDVPIWLSEQAVDDRGFLWLSEQSEDELSLSTRTASGITSRFSPLEGHNSPIWPVDRIRLLGVAAVSSDGLQRVLRAVSRSDLISTDIYHVDDVSVFPSNMKTHRFRNLAWSTPRTEPYSSDGVFSRDFSVWVHILATPTTTMTWSIYSWTSGDFTKPIATLQSRTEPPSITPRIEYALARVPSGPSELVFPAAIIRPRDFDPKNKYPVLNFAYTGPGVNTVQPNGRAYLLHQWFADQGFIVVTIDGRGTPRRGRAWERAIKNDMIGVALQDQCDGLLALCDKFPEMDRDRIGVYGWSYGGYFAAMAAMQRPDIFKAGVAGAPVADWRDYDTHYTERYLGMPLPADQLTDGVPGNQSGYDESNVLTYCKDLQVPLLLIHGTADDNVYFTHSLKIADALTRANKPYEFMPLSGQTHMVTQPALVKAINTRMAEFFITHLGKPQ
jgi:dipeptidyl-peptidase 4